MIIISLLLVILLLYFIYIKHKKESFINKNEFYIMTIATENYSKNLLNSLNTFKKSNSGIIVHIYCINWSDNNFNKLKKIFPEYNFIKYQDDKINNKLKNIKSGYVIKLKIKLIYKCFSEHKKNVLFFDADTKITNKIEKIFDKYNNYDVLITNRPDRKRNRELFATGVMGFSYNKKTKYFLKQYNYNTFNNITKKEDYHPGTIDGWWHDQIGFLKTYKQFPNIKYYFFKETEHNLSGKHNPKQKKINNAIFQSY